MYFLIIQFNDNYYYSLLLTLCILPHGEHVLTVLLAAKRDMKCKASLLSSGTHGAVVVTRECVH